MNDFWFAVFLAVVFFILGFGFSYEMWTDRAKNGTPVVVNGKVYRIIEQRVIANER